MFDNRFFIQVNLIRFCIHAHMLTTLFTEFDVFTSITATYLVCYYAGIFIRKHNMKEFGLILNAFLIVPVLQNIYMGVYSQYLFAALILMDNHCLLQGRRDVRFSNLVV